MSKTIIYFFLFFLLNCSTYWAHRKNDLKDVFNIGIEKPGYGFGFRMSYLSMGFFFQGGETAPGKKDIGSGYGLRGGDTGKYFTQHLVFGILGGESFYAGEPKKDSEDEIVIEENIVITNQERSNLKSYNVKYLKIFIDPPIERQKRNKQKIKEQIANQLLEKNKDPALLAYLPPKPKKPNGYGASYPYQFDIFIGLYYGIRLGVNFSEFLDFILGFSSLDIMGDDLIIQEK